MKNKTTLHDEIECNNLSKSGNGAVGQRRRCFKLGLDVELRNVAVAIQCERGGIGPAQKLSLQQLIGWVKQKVAQGHAVYTVYECCGFGYTLHEQLGGSGSHFVHHYADALEPGAAKTSFCVDEAIAQIAVRRDCGVLEKSAPRRI